MFYNNSLDNTFKFLVIAAIEIMTSKTRNDTLKILACYEILFLNKIT